MNLYESIVIEAFNNLGVFDESIQSFFDISNHSQLISIFRFLFTTYFHDNEQFGETAVLSSFLINEISIKMDLGNIKDKIAKEKISFLRFFEIQTLVYSLLAFRGKFLLNDQVFMQSLGDLDANMKAMFLNTLTLYGKIEDIGSFCKILNDKYLLEILDTLDKIAGSKPEKISTKKLKTVYEAKKKELRILHCDSQALKNEWLYYKNLVEKSKRIEQLNDDLSVVIQTREQLQQQIESLKANLLCLKEQFGNENDRLLTEYLLQLEKDGVNEGVFKDSEIVQLYLKMKKQYHKYLHKKEMLLELIEETDGLLSNKMY